LTDWLLLVRKHIHVGFLYNLLILVITLAVHPSKGVSIYLNNYRK